MALYDTADLLARCKRLAKRPDTDMETQDTDWYRYLTDAQLYVIGQFQIHFPRLNWDVWEKMTPAPDLLSYTFTGTPLGRVEIHPSKKAPYTLRPGAPDDHTADFYWDGESTIRMTGDVPRTFPDGPYARYTARPDDITAGVQPVLLPPEARLLMVYKAVAAWAHEGGLRDPAFYDDLYDELWHGKRAGDVGLLGQLKVRYGSSSHGAQAPWYKSVDLSDLPVRTG